MGKNNCKRCKSGDVIRVDSSNVAYKSYSIVESFGGSTQTTHSGVDLFLIKYVCLGCGNVFEQVDEKSLNSYILARKYF